MECLEQLWLCKTHPYELYLMLGVHTYIVRNCHICTTHMPLYSMQVTSTSDLCPHPSLVLVLWPLCDVWCIHFEKEPPTSQLRQTVEGVRHKKVWYRVPSHHPLRIWIPFSGGKIYTLRIWDTFQSIFNARNLVGANKEELDTQVYVKHTMAKLLTTYIYSLEIHCVSANAQSLKWV